jgi:hypothetical protein
MAAISQICTSGDNNKYYFRISSIIFLLMWFPLTNEIFPLHQAPYIDILHTLSQLEELYSVAKNLCRATFSLSSHSRTNSTGCLEIHFNFMQLLRFCLLDFNTSKFESIFAIINIILGVSI